MAMHVYLEENTLRQGNKRKGTVLNKLDSHWPIQVHFNIPASMCAFEYKYIICSSSH